jgi:hypothetical protein
MSQFQNRCTRYVPLSPRQTESIDTLVGAEMARQQIPGLAVGIYSRGRILLAKGYGRSLLGVMMRTIKTYSKRRLLRNSVDRPKINEKMPS